MSGAREPWSGIECPCPRRAPIYNTSKRNLARKFWRRWSLTPLWRGANFMEREVWDLFGIRFTDHPDLRRVLLYDEFQGHPLRKDYPVNLWQPRVPERKVEGTFVDERSRNKLLLLKQILGNKAQS